MFPEAKIYIDGKLIGEGALKNYQITLNNFENAPDKIEQLIFEFELEPNIKQLNAIINLGNPETFRHKITGIYRNCKKRLKHVQMEMFA